MPSTHRRFIAFVLGLFVGCVTQVTSTERVSAQERVPEIAELKTSNAADDIKLSLQRRVAYLASEELRGRGVTQDEMVLARDYVREQMAEAGLSLDLADGGAFQTIEIPTGNELKSKESNFATFKVGDEEIKAAVDDGFSPLAVGMNEAVLKGPVVFAGYGITAPDLNYDDYDGIDVKDAIVIVLRKEPGAADPESPFNGVENTRHAYFQTKIINAANQGAAALLIVNDAGSVEDAVAEEQARIDQEMARKATLEESLAALPEDAAKNRVAMQEKITQTQSMIDSITVDRESASRGVLGLNDAGGKSRRTRDLPVGSIARDVVDQLLQTVGTSLKEAEAAIDSEYQPVSKVIDDADANVSIALKSAVAKTDNVIGYLPGKGPLASEYLVVGAHYDHVGMGGYGSLAPGTIAVHNGADDNASGTSTMLATADLLGKQLATAAAHRTVIFIAFTGEERGLLGSKHYVANPLKPLEQTVAMINLDMVGRMRDNEVTVYGTGTATGLDALVDTTNEEFNFKIEKQPGGYGPSDHDSFYRGGIPVLFFFTGLHNDYHRPTDDFDKINYEDMTRITEMVGKIAVKLATQPERPEYVETNGRARITRQRTAYLGIQVAADEVRVTEVVEGGPAEKAGLKVDDVIESLQGKPVTTSQDVSSWVRARSAGTAFEMQVRRGEEVLSLSGKLEKRTD